MFYVSNEIQYRVVCVPGDPDEHWCFLNHYDNLADAQRAVNAQNERATDGDHYHVTAIGGADSLRAAFSKTPPAAV